MSPNQEPPESYDGTPAYLLLTAGTRLTRIHSVRFGVTEFNPTVARSPFAGGRFDAIAADQYAFLYAAADDRTAISEALLRDLPIDERGACLLPRVRLSDLRISWLVTTLDMQLVSLRSGQDLASVGQDAWLTVAPATEYPVTRRWASAIRAWAPRAVGLTWRSLREPAGFAFVFFSDRCPPGAFVESTHDLPVPTGEQDLDTGPARVYVEEVLVRYRVALM